MNSSVPIGCETGWAATSARSASKRRFLRQLLSLNFSTLRPLLPEPSRLASKPARKTSRTRQNVVQLVQQWLVHGLSAVPRCCRDPKLPESPGDEPFSHSLPVETPLVADWWCLETPWIPPSWPSLGLPPNTCGLPTVSLLIFNFDGSLLSPLPLVDCVGDSTRSSSHNMFTKGSADRPPSTLLRCMRPNLTAISNNPHDPRPRQPNQQRTTKQQVRRRAHDQNEDDTKDDGGQFLSVMGRRQPTSQPSTCPSSACLPQRPKRRLKHCQRHGVTVSLEDCIGNNSWQLSSRQKDGKPKVVTTRRSRNGDCRRPPTFEGGQSTL